MALYGRNLLKMNNTLVKWFKVREATSLCHKSGPAAFMLRWTLLWTYIRRIFLSFLLEIKPGSTENVYSYCSNLLLTLAKLSDCKKHNFVDVTMYERFFFGRIINNYSTSARWIQDGKRRRRYLTIANEIINCFTKCYQILNVRMFRTFFSSFNSCQMTRNYELIIGVE